MNTKAYKILKIILEHPNEWQSVPNLASEVDMTRRQVTAVICAYRYLPLEKDRGNYDCTYVMFKGTDDEANDVLAQITEEYYGITDDMKEKIYNALSPVAWMSIMDIAEDTNINKGDVTHALGLIDGVITKTSGVLVLYRRESEAC